MSFIDGSVVKVALPAIQNSLGTNVATMQWVVNGYMPTSAKGSGGVSASRSSMLQKHGRPEIGVYGNDSPEREQTPQQLELAGNTPHLHVKIVVQANPFRS